MRTLAVLATAVLVASLPVTASAQTSELSYRKNSVTSAGTSSGPLMRAASREASRLASLPRAGAPRQVQTSTEDTRGWVERHPVWSGAIGGAGIGALWGVASCSGSCFPIGRGGSALFGAGFGAGIGALVGWGIGAID